MPISLLKSPATAFALFAALALACMALAALAVAQLPRTSFEIRPGAAGMVEVTGAAPFDETAPAAIVAPDGSARLLAPMVRFLSTSEFRGSPAENAAEWRDRARLAALLTEPGLALRLPDGRLVPARALPGGLATLAPSAVLSLGMGLCALLIGLWPGVVRPRDWTSRALFANGAALAVVTVTLAINVQASPASGPALHYWNTQANYLATYLWALALLVLFARHPFPIVPRGALYAVALWLVGVWVAGVALPWRDVPTLHLLNALGLGVAILATAGLQARRARTDPAHRAAFRLVGAALVICISLFTALNFVPQLLIGRDLLPIQVTACALLLVYLALAVAISRYRLFDLGSWAVKATVAALVLLAVLVLDLVLVLATGAGWTLSLPFLAAVIAWLPAREILLRRFDARRNRRDILLLRGASEVAFAVSSTDRAARWQALLAAQFAPLEITPCSCDALEIRDDGRRLAVPSPVGGAGLLLGFAGQGRQLFGSADRAVAAALLTLVREMDEARAAYDRGVATERARIARDLHDDVGARLMTSLHREDLAAVRAELREAMSDMRQIIDGMTGPERPLGELLADLRHETVSRLALAGIGADWPAGVAFDDDRPVPAPLGRVLVSVLRELASNTIRHSGAAQVQVGCSLSGGTLALRFADDGCGLAAEGAARPGNGLRNIRRRIEETGGEIALHSAATGTAVELRLPLASRG